MAPRVWVSTQVLNEVTRECLLRPQLETGGLLLGYWSGDTVVITDTVGPGPDALHAATSFRPDARWQREALAAMYAASGRVTTYLGDWHVHPGGSSAPSRTDRGTLRRIARSASARQPRPLMGIVAPAADSDLSLWLFRPWFRDPQLLSARSM